MAVELVTQKIMKKFLSIIMGIRGGSRGVSEVSRNWSRIFKQLKGLEIL